ncbi:GGDEF domain-containing protein [Paenibacillus sp. GD4]|uniref:GGDEF domain-containing protein n=1 Tax=Paenibacillus sp. GD4 TaxID=3068890 RepID=UPI002796B66E|nr:GGDEF domain-containing protein [Paenibacillus sp. GD4]MDQ1911707.1 GGDEF domain-containing protein [Paenibacillus sp. GD4]
MTYSAAPPPIGTSIHHKLPLLRRARMLVLVYALVYFGLLLVLQPPYGRIASDVLSPVGVMLSLLLMGYSLRHQQGKLRRAWQLFFSGALLYGIGETLWRLQDLYVWQGSVPAAYTTADLFFAVLPVVFIGAILSLLHSYRPMLTIHAAFDILITMVTIGTLNWHFIFLPILNPSGIDGGRAVLLLMYPIGALGCFLGSLFMYYSYHTHGSRSLSLLHIVFASGLWCIAIQIYVMKTIAGSYASGDWIDPLWACGLLMLGLSSLTGTDRPLADPQAPDTRRKLGAHPLLPYVAFVLLLAVMIFVTPPLDELMIGILVSLVLIIIRQFLTLADNRRLFGLLEQSNEKLERQGRRLLQQQKELEAAFEELQRLNLLKEMEARTDYLTGLMNRRSIQERMNKVWERAERTGELFCILLLDLDHFKQINDQYGHDSGDRLLESFSRLLQKEARTGDAIARFGGEEFLILLPDTGLDAALALAERLLKQLAAIEHRSGEGAVFRVTTSIGAAQWQGPGEPLHSLLVRADQALYEAKRTGRNRVCVV